MTALDEARLHLAKAREFLDAAQASHELGLDNAATSDAVISAINSKDAICLALTGRTDKTDNHTRAVGELRRSGTAGAAVATTLSRLLNLKTKSQYASQSVSTADTTKALEWRGCTPPPTPSSATAKRTPNRAGPTRRQPYNHDVVSVLVSVVR